MKKFFGLLFLLSGCSTLGDSTVYSARPAYNEAIAQTSTQQLLLNLVRMKFRDAPVFLQVGSIATQYTFTRNALLNPFFNPGDSDLSAALGLLYTEEPTITFTPLQGEQFARQFMSRIPVETLTLLANSGWSIERILRCCVRSVNGILNAPTAAGPTPSLAPDYREFQRLSKLFRKLQERGDLRIETGPGSTLLLDVSRNARTKPLLSELRAMLHVSSAQALPPIHVVPRSLYGSLFYLGQGVEPPIEAVEAGLVTQTKDEDGNDFDWSEFTKLLMTIKSSESKPNKSYVSVFYRNSYYYVADDDLGSKATLMLLDQLISLQSGAPATNAAPALTLSVGK